MSDDYDDLPDPLDLPSLSSKPSYAILVVLLDKLRPLPPSWTSPLLHRPKHNYVPWLTRLIATPLSWLTTSEQDIVMSMASCNLALRAGPSALPDMTRMFMIEGHCITLFEPSLTEDLLGHKTWGSSLLLAKRLSILYKLSKSPCLASSARVDCLGLGEGTGLLGIAAAKVTNWSVTLTDLPGITDNLRRNVQYNCGDGAVVRSLDWASPPSDEEIPSESFDVIIASDLFYDTHHPEMVVAMLERYLKRDDNARVVIEYPLRSSHAAEVKDFESRVTRSLVVENTGEEVGRDDWDAEVPCRWNIYKRIEKSES
jgi:predicted nicotinamide N-methyase